MGRPAFHVPGELLRTSAVFLRESTRRLTKVGVTLRVVMLVAHASHPELKGILHCIKAIKSHELAMFHISHKRIPT